MAEYNNQSIDIDLEDMFNNLTAPTDTSRRNKIRMATVLKRKLEKKLLLSE